MIDMQQVVHNRAIEKLIAAMDAILRDQVIRTGQALIDINQGNRNGAIGAILELDQAAETVASLYRSAVVLQRRAP